MHRDQCTSASSTGAFNRNRKPAIGAGVNFGLYVPRVITGVKSLSSKDKKDL